MDLVTDNLKRKLANANGKMKEIERERAERRKVRKKTKNAATVAPSASTSTTAPVANDDVTMADTTLAAGELEDENVIQEREKKEFEATIDPELKADIGASVSGLFELCGEHSSFFR